MIRIKDVFFDKIRTIEIRKSDSWVVPGHISLTGGTLTEPKDIPASWRVLVNDKEVFTYNNPDEAENKVKNLLAGKDLKEIT